MLDRALLQRGMCNVCVHRIDASLLIGFLYGPISGLELHHSACGSILSANFGPAVNENDNKKITLISHDWSFDLRPTKNIRITMYNTSRVQDFFVEFAIINPYINNNASSFLFVK
jgi:hypothetical protein